MPDAPKPTAPVYRRSRFLPALSNRPDAERIETETLRLAADRPALLIEMRKWAEGNEHEGEQQYWQLVLDAALTAMAVDARNISVLSAANDGVTQELQFKATFEDGVFWEYLSVGHMHSHLAVLDKKGSYAGQTPSLEFRTVFHQKNTPWMKYEPATEVEPETNTRTELIDAARTDSTFIASPMARQIVDQLVVDAQAIADQDIEIARLSRIESAEHAAWMEECRAKLDSHATYLAEHDDKPDMYLGHLQPGASPSFYGPDDVVVDGDWLAKLETDYTFATARVEELEKGRS